jgi:hypothetical protein
MSGECFSELLIQVEKNNTRQGIDAVIKITIRNPEDAP